MPSNYNEFKKQRQRYAAVNKRDLKVQALQAENTPESRKARRAMNDVRLSERQTLGNAWSPDGKYRTTAKCSAGRINKNFKSQS